MILVLKENQELGKINTAMIRYFKEKDFTVELKPISGGESITLETVISGQDGKFSYASSKVDYSMGENI